MMKAPKLSVLLPNYNHAKYLPEALDAILGQSFQDFEILIIDDASTDNSIQVIQSYQKNHPQIQLYQNEKNLGPVLSMNRGMKHARGSYLAFCAADDLLFPNFFQNAIHHLEENRDIGICSTDPSYFQDISPYHHKIKRLLLSKQPQILSGETLVRLLRQTPLRVHSHGSIYRKSHVDEYGAMDPKLKWLCDWHFNHQIAFKHGIIHLPKAYASLRQSPHTYSSRGRKNNHTLLFQHLMKLIDVHNYRQSAILLHIGWPMIKFILARPKYWLYLPWMFEKSLRMIFIKIFRRRAYFYEY